MDKKYYDLYDKVVSTTLVNFMIEDNRNYGLVLYNFDPIDVDHLYAFEVALLLSNSIHKIFYLDMNFFNYWKFKINNWTVRKNFERYKKHTEIIPLELEKILKYMKDDLFLEDDIYRQIYEEYYKMGNENRKLFKNIFKRKRRK